MAEFYNNGECIDGERVLIRFKKILPQPYTYIVSPTGFKGTKYKCSRDGSAEISKSLSADETEAAIKLKPSVHFEVGDCLKCNKMFFIAQTRKKLNCFRVTMMSGRHECNEGTPDVRIYAEIETPFENIVHAVEKRLIEMRKQHTLGDNNPIAGVLG